MNRILSLQPKLGLICLLIISMQTSIINCGEEGQNKKRRTGDIGLADGAGAGAGSGDAGAGIMLLAEMATAEKIEPRVLCGTGAGGAGVIAAPKKRLTTIRKGPLSKIINEYFRRIPRSKRATSKCICTQDGCKSIELNASALQIQSHLINFHPDLYKKIIGKNPDFEPHCTAVKETSKTIDAATRAARNAARSAARRATRRAAQEAAK